jgi:CRP-like cAMP-binding protein
MPQFTHAVRPPSTSAPQSDLLAVLHAGERALLEPHCADCVLAAGAVISRPGDNIEYCYLPTGPALCALSTELEDGATVETILIGREGAVGGVVSSGPLPAYSCVTVLCPGLFLRIPLRELERAKQASPAIASLFSRYADCLLAQVFQSIACNAAHTIEQRAAKWVLAAVDRTGNAGVSMTQEQLAAMMGIGRSYASRVLQTLKRDGLLRTRRGGFAVLDHAELRNRACSCNEQLSAHCERVLAGVYPATT